MRFKEATVCVLLSIFFASAAMSQNRAFIIEPSDFNYKIGVDSTFYIP